MIKKLAIGIDICGSHISCAAFDFLLMMTKIIGIGICRIIPISKN